MEPPSEGAVQLLVEEAIRALLPTTELDEGAADAIVHRLLGASCGEVYGHARRTIELALTRSRPDFGDRAVDATAELLARRMSEGLENPLVDSTAILLAELSQPVDTADGAAVASGDGGTGALAVSGTDTLSTWSSDGSEGGEDPEVSDHAQQSDGDRANGRPHPEERGEVLDLDHLRNEFRAAQASKASVTSSHRGLVLEALRAVRGCFGAVFGLRDGRVTLAATPDLSVAERAVLHHFAIVAQDSVDVRVTAKVLKTRHVQRVVLQHAAALDVIPARLESVATDSLLESVMSLGVYEREVAALLGIVSEIAQEGDIGAEQVIFAHATAPEALERSPSVALAASLFLRAVEPHLELVDGLCSNGALDEDLPEAPEPLRGTYAMAERTADALGDLRRLEEETEQVGAPPRHSYPKLGLRVYAEEAARQFQKYLGAVTADGPALHGAIHGGPAEAEGRHCDAGPAEAELGGTWALVHAVGDLVRQRCREVEMDTVVLLHEHLRITDQLARLRDATFSRAVADCEQPFAALDPFLEEWLDDAFREALDDAGRGPVPAGGWLALNLRVVEAEDDQAELAPWRVRLSFEGPKIYTRLVEEATLESLNEVLTLALSLRRAMHTLDNLRPKTAEGVQVKMELSHVLRTLRGYVLTTVAHRGWYPELASAIYASGTVGGIRDAFAQWVRDCEDSCFLAGNTTPMRNAFSRLLGAARQLALRGDHAVPEVATEVRHCVRFLLGALVKLRELGGTRADVCGNLFCQLDINRFFSSKIIELAGSAG